jgi:hypothetical protein
VLLDGAFDRGHGTLVAGTPQAMAFDETWRGALTRRHWA